MRRVLWGAIVSAALVGSLGAATSTEAAGLDGLHSKVQIGNRLCMAGHTHHGAGQAWGTREKALASAAKSWGSFTALEYGAEWADFGQSSNQDISCWPSRLGHGPTHWTCSLTSSPCKVTQAGHAGPVAVAAPAHRKPRGQPVRRAHTAQAAQPMSPVAPMYPGVH